MVTKHVFCVIFFLVSFLPQGVDCFHFLLLNRPLDSYRLIFSFLFLSLGAEKTGKRKYNDGYCSVCRTDFWIVCMHRPSGHGNLLPFALEDLIISVGNQYQVTTQDWFSQKKGHDEERDPRVVFNVLDAMLKDSLERLKMMRSAFDFC